MACFAIRVLMLHATQQRQGLEVDRLSFPHAVCVLKRYLPDFQRTQQKDWPCLHQRLLGEVREEVLPPRRLRSKPRVIKRRASKFRTKQPEHLHPPQTQKGTAFRDLLLLI